MCYKRKRLHTLIAPFQGFFKALQLRVTAGISLRGRWRQGALRRLKANIDLLKEKPLYYKFCGWLKTYKFHQWSTIITEDYSFPALKLSTHPCSPFFCPQFKNNFILTPIFFPKAEESHDLSTPHEWMECTYQTIYLCKISQLFLARIPPFCYLVHNITFIISNQRLILKLMKEKLLKWCLVCYTMTFNSPHL